MARHQRCALALAEPADHAADLRRAARHVSGDAETCYAALGKPACCGTCLDEADEILQEEREMGCVAAAA